VAREPRLLHWVEFALATPGMTALQEAGEAWKVLVDEALVALPYIKEGPVIDVGSGNGSPGLPLAASLPDLRFDLLESSGRKCAFLREAAAAFPNVDVVCARAEEHARGTVRDSYGAALARALAPQAVAAEWCLPFVRPGGVLILYAARPDPGLDRVAAQLGAARPHIVEDAGQLGRTLIVFPKLDPTPDRFPRRTGVARKRPLT
jgi:16S rRNA (guanine527-N7)-methyltransferase